MPTDDRNPGATWQLTEFDLPNAAKPEGSWTVIMPVIDGWTGAYAGWVRGTTFWLDGRHAD